MHCDKCLYLSQASQQTYEEKKEGLLIPTLQRNWSLERFKELSKITEQTNEDLRLQIQVYLTPEGKFSTTVLKYWHYFYFVRTINTGLCDESLSRSK